MNKYKLFILLMLACFFLSACGQTPPKEKENPLNKNIEKKEPIYSSLSIDNSCIGCGRCIALDNKHFGLKNGVVKVISNKDLNSNNLEKAINICPTSSITRS